MTAADHLDDLMAALERFRIHRPTIEWWGLRLAGIFDRGGRLLACGNGGSAAEAQHLTAELVGRFRRERRALPAIPLHADTSTMTAIGNDYGPDSVFARQVEAHAGPGDVLVCLSASGRSANVLAAVRAARRQSALTWALTGPAPNPLSGLADEAVVVEAKDTAIVQEVHLTVIHMLCDVVDGTLEVAK